MPNWTYLVVHFVHSAALALWVGGGLALDALVIPTVRRLLDSESSERLERSLIERFERLQPPLIAALALTSGLLVGWFGRLSPWYAIEYVCIGMMSASALFSLGVATPRRRALRRTLPHDAPAVRALDQTAALARHFNLACGSVALFFS